MKKLFALLIALLSMASLCADGTIKWEWTTGGGQDDTVRYYRYQIDGTEENGWTVIPIETNFCVYEANDNDFHTIYLQASYDGEHWSEIAENTAQALSLLEEEVKEPALEDKYKFVEEEAKEYSIENKYKFVEEENKIPSPVLNDEPAVKEETPASAVTDTADEADTITKKKIPKSSLRFTISPFPIGIYDFYNGHNIPNARYLTCAPFGFGVKADYGFYCTERLRLNLEYSYTVLFRYKHIIPNEEMVQYHKIIAGVEYALIKDNVFSLMANLNGGVLLGVIADKFDINSIIGTGISASWAITNALSMGITSSVSFSFSKHSDPLYNSMSYIVEPISVFAEVRF